MLKTLSKIKNSIISSIVGISLSVVNILAGHNFLEYIVSIIGDMLSVVFDYDEEKQTDMK